MGRQLPEDGGVDEVVVAGARVLDVSAASELGGGVEHGFHGLRGHVVALEPGAESAGDVELGGLGGAEIPAVAGSGGVGAAGVEEGAQLLHPLADLVVAEQRRPPSPQFEEDEHGVAAAMVVAPAPG